MKNEKLKIVFIGTAEFAVPALAALFESGQDIAFVVTQPDRKRGRGGRESPTPVGLYAEENGLPVLKPERLKENAEFFAMLTKAAPDLIVVAAYGKILPKSLLELPPLGCVNIHASLLPEYRGAAPVQRAMLDGKEIVGVTLMHMAEGLDTGDMIASAQTEVAEMNAGEVTDKLARLGADLLLGLLPALAERIAPRIPQDEAKATYAEKIGKNDERLDLFGAAEAAARRVRAMAPAPGAYVLRGGERIGVVKARALGPEDCGEPEWVCEAASPGEVLAVSNRGIYVRMGEGVLLIEELKMPGRKATPVAEYLKGNVFDKTMPLE